MDFASAQAALARAGVQFDPGLTPDEFAAIKAEWGFRFPPDLREFLSLALPVSGGWINWRTGDREAIRNALSWPLEGLCFDIEHNVFWLAEWGDRPAQLAGAIEIARRAVNAAPTLIPICSHRYLPATPAEAGNPVFSVYQTDVIYYGTDLLDYLQNEFRYYFGRPEYRINGEPRRIPFWSDLAG
jgi:hypothetical protein